MVTLSWQWIKLCLVTVTNKMQLQCKWTRINVIHNAWNSSRKAINQRSTLQIRGNLGKDKRPVLTGIKKETFSQEEGEALQIQTASLLPLWRPAAAEDIQTVKAEAPGRRERSLKLTVGNERRRQRRIGTGVLAGQLKPWKWKWIGQVNAPRPARC